MYNPNFLFTFVVKLIEMIETHIILEDVDPGVVYGVDSASIQVGKAV